MINIRLFIILVSLGTSRCFEHEVTPSCGPEVKSCEFNWTVDYLETMVVFNDNGRGFPVVVRNESLVKRTACDTFDPLTDSGKYFYLVHSKKFKGTC